MPRAWSCYLINVSLIPAGLVFEMLSKTRKTIRSTLNQITVKDELCKRCRLLALEAFLTKPVYEINGLKLDAGSTTITKQSLQENCILCCQLAVFLRNAGTDGLLQLSCHDAWNARMRRYNPYITLLNPDSSPSVHLFLAEPDRAQHVFSSNLGLRRAAGQLLPTHPDFELAKKWLRHCREEHKTVCVQDRKVFVSPLRLIDCAIEELCIADPDCPYVALSYTWGNVTSEDLLPSLSLPKHLPKTVKDAIAVARALDISYLWVDRYASFQGLLFLQLK
jgi:hypothetical protein